MSKITSLSGTKSASNQPVTVTSKTTTASDRIKALTDFSIDSLIGPASNCSPGRQTTQQDGFCCDCEQHQNQIDRPTTSIQEESTTTTKTTTTATKTTTSDMRLETSPTVVQSIKKYRPKNFQCPACKMAFSNNGQLKNHVRIHTGERPFTCNYLDCNKTFTRNEELTRHKLIHTGVRPHVCTCCGKRFGRKDHLKKHIRTHERKRMRKKVFVPTSRPKSIIITGNEDQEKQNQQLSSPSHVKKISNNYKHDGSAGIGQIIPSSNNLIQTTANSIIPIAPSPYQLHTNPITSTTISTSPTSCLQSSRPPFLQPPPIRSLTPNTASTIHQIASDYWQKWYSFMGLYQHHPQQQPHQQMCPNLGRFGDMFRR